MTTRQKKHRNGTVLSADSGSSARSALAFYEDLHPPADDFEADALAGLRAPQKKIAPKYFYDKKGSDLFEKICETDEYYVTRTEIALLEELAPTFADLAGQDASIVEFGSGAGVKIRLLLDGLDKPAHYVAIDISRRHLLDSAETLASDYPDLDIGAICADFSDEIALPSLVQEGGGKCLGFLAGSTIGNFTPDEAQGFLARTAKMLKPGGALLVGVDLKKDKARLAAAYNDQEGMTAAFNLNLLHRLQNELGADIDPGTFTHQAFYNAQKGRIEMHLESTQDQEITLSGENINFNKGETIHTESSYKYTEPEFAALAEKSGFWANHVWTDAEGLFSLHWLEVPV